MPKLYIISGCNGSGKTTASYTILPEILNCREFVNADNIALGISPFNPEKVAFEAGRVMLERIKDLLNREKDFAFETTLAARFYTSFIKEAKKKDYEVTLLYLWLSSPEMAKERVAARVLKGGHDIPEKDIERRYFRGIKNLFELYIPLCDNWMVIDNMDTVPEVIAQGSIDESEAQIKNKDIWKQILDQK